MKFIKTEHPYFIAIKEDIAAMILIVRPEINYINIDVRFKNGTAMNVEFSLADVEIAKKILADFERD